MLSFIKFNIANFFHDNMLLVCPNNVCTMTYFHLFVLMLIVTLHRSDMAKSVLYVIMFIYLHGTSPPPSTTAIYYIGSESDRDYFNSNFDTSTI